MKNKHEILKSRGRINMQSLSQYTVEQDRQFMNYMRQYKDRYKSQHGEDGIWEVLCEHGDIEPYSLTELCCYQGFKSNNRLKNIKSNLPDYCTITQEAGAEIVFKFPNKKFEEIAELVKAKKRRVLTPEQKAALVAMGTHTRFKRHGGDMAQNR